MKFLDRLISFIFSLAVLVVAVTVILVITGYVDVDMVYSILNKNVFAEEVKQASLITAIVALLASLKVTVFNSRFKSKEKESIMVETTRGVIEISQDTIDNTVKSVASEFPEIKEVQAKMLKKKDGIKIYAAISVLANTNIRTLTATLQEKIEQVIDETTGIKTLSTNIKVKNIYEKNKKNDKNEIKKSDTSIKSAEKKTETKTIVNEEKKESTTQNTSSDSSAKESIAE